VYVLVYICISVCISVCICTSPEGEYARDLERSGITRTWICSWERTLQIRSVESSPHVANSSLRGCTARPHSSPLEWPQAIRVRAWGSPVCAFISVYVLVNVLVYLLVYVLVYVLVLF
jgi:hypothetical protein